MWPTPLAVYGLLVTWDGRKTKEGGKGGKSERTTETITGRSRKKIEKENNRKERRENQRRHTRCIAREKSWPAISVLLRLEPSDHILCRLFGDQQCVAQIQPFPFFFLLFLPWLHFTSPLSFSLGFYRVTLSSWCVTVKGDGEKEEMEWGREFQLLIEDLFMNESPYFEASEQ